MTAQLRKKETIQERPESADFLCRWLHGSLTEAELASLRNREEYEELMAGGQLQPIANSEHPIGGSPARFSKNKPAATTVHVLPTFAALAVVALLATYFFAKTGGWF